MKHITGLLIDGPRAVIVGGMPRPTSLTTLVQPLVKKFTADLAALVDATVMDRVRDAVIRALGVGDRQRRAGPVPREPRTPATRTSAPNRARVLQGRYMGGLRGLTKPAQARVKRVRQKQGIAAALRLIDQLR